MTIITVDFERVSVREMIFRLDRQVMTYYCAVVFGEEAEREMWQECMELESQLDVLIAEYIGRWGHNPFEPAPPRKVDFETQKLRNDLQRKISKLRALAKSTTFPGEAKVALELARKLELQIRA